VVSLSGDFIILFDLSRTNQGKRRNWRDGLKGRINGSEKLSPLSRVKNLTGLGKSRGSNRPGIPFKKEVLTGKMFSSGRGNFLCG
jgi:hypothetical protein